MRRYGFYKKYPALVEEPQQTLCPTSPALKQGWGTNTDPKFEDNQHL